MTEVADSVEGEQEESQGALNRPTEDLEGEICQGLAFAWPSLSPTIHPPSQSRSQADLTGCGLLPGISNDSLEAAECLER